MSSLITTCSKHALVESIMSARQSRQECLWGIVLKFQFYKRGKGEGSGGLLETITQCLPWARVALKQNMLALTCLIRNTMRCLQGAKQNSNVFRYWKSYSGEKVFSLREGPWSWINVYWTVIQAHHSRHSILLCCSRPHISMLLDSEGSLVHLVNMQRPQ